jgi:hypothetical protein
MLLFHKRDPRVGPTPFPTTPPTAPSPPALDFHQVVASLAAHPPLLRLLGLAFDLQVAVGAPIPVGGTVSVVPHWTSSLPLGASVDVRPATHFDASFLPASSTGEISQGLVLLDPPDAYDLIEVDVDGAVLRLVDFAAMIDRATTIGVAGYSTGSVDTPQDYATPALRSRGLSLARRGHAGKVASRVNASMSQELVAGTSPPGAPDLWAEDVTRGWRIDVLDTTTGAWGQLCSRAGKPGEGYDFVTSSTVVPVPAGDEGWIEMAMTTDPERPSNDPTHPDAFVPETLLRWDGWSLVAPRPGKFLGKGPKDGPTTEPGADLTTAPHGLDIRYVAAPGTLPVLRFGRRYRMRARAVDVAGNSISFTGVPNGVGLSPEVSYGRLEPVLSPAMLMRKARGEGESVENLVIRGNYNVSDSPGVTLPTERHLVPPRTPQQLAEEHGVLDTGGRPDPTLYAEIANRESATFIGGTPDPGTANQPYFDVDNVGVPYLPDVLTAGVAFQGLPGIPASVTTFPVPFYEPTESWPNPHSVRLRLEAGNLPPDPPTGANGHVLTVFLAKAGQATVRFSSFLAGSRALDELTLYQWALANPATAPFAPALAAAITEGRSWMVTPWRTLTMVHAVRQPLVAPTVSPITATKGRGDTAAKLFGTVVIDRASTQKLELLAQWDEYLDPVGEAGPSTTPSRAVPVTRTLDLTTSDPDPDSIALSVVTPNSSVDVLHEFRDTKHRTVFYEAVATTRFAEFFMQHATLVLTGTAAVLLSALGVVVGPDTVTNADGTVTYTRDTDYMLDEVAGTIARTATSMIPPDATVAVAFLVPPIVRTSFAGRPQSYRGVQVDILSSARPDVPKLEYTLPAFSWQSSGVAPATVTSTRRGRLVRVYLDRPWYSSGGGELLGVVLTSQGGAPTSADMPFVTQWGDDPLLGLGSWETPVLDVPSLAVGDFPLAVASVSGVYFPDTGTLYDVAAHAVSYDPHRRLWFCDIQVGATDRYWPLVRLALARFQPDSLTSPDLRLSPVVLAEFAQLAPDRTASFLFPSTRSVSIMVSGAAPRVESGGDHLLGSVVEVTVETQKRNSAITDSDLVWHDPGTVIALNRQVVSTPSPGVDWQGTISLPHPRGKAPMRLVVREWEVWAADPDVTGGPQTGRRLVHLDTLAI